MLEMEISNQKVPEISVVVLCYREGLRVKDFNAKLVQFLSQAGLDYEIILVGNYFPNTGDETPRVVKELAQNNQRIRAVALEKPKGGIMGWDVRSGLKEARGKTIAFIDGDGQMPIEDIVSIYKKLRADKLDLCKTARKVREDSFGRKILSKIYNAIFKILFWGISDKDINSKPKIFTREAYEKLDLRSNDWFLDAEIMIKAKKLGFKCGWIPTVFRKNQYRKSFVKPLFVLEFIKNLIIYRLKI